MDLSPLILAATMPSLPALSVTATAVLVVVDADTARRCWPTRVQVQQLESPVGKRRQVKCSAGDHAAVAAAGQRVRRRAGSRRRDVTEPASFVRLSTSAPFGNRDAPTLSARQRTGMFEHLACLEVARCESDTRSG